MIRYIIVSGVLFSSVNFFPFKQELILEQTIFTINIIPKLVEKLSANIGIICRRCSVDDP